MKSIDVCGVGNGIVDIFADVSDAEFSHLGFEKATMRLVEPADQLELLQKFRERGLVMRSGGAVGNSLIAVAQLGGKSAMYCRLADDEYGRFYRNECVEMGMRMPVPSAAEGTTGTCVALITPDAERTMRTALGVSTLLSAEHVEPAVITDSKWLFIEGFVLSNSDAGRSAVEEAVRIASETDTKVALTCCEAWVVKSFGEALWKALSRAHLIFANEEEAMALADEADILAAGRKLSAKFPHLVFTAGPRGAFIWWEGTEIQVPSFPCEPRDLTGAGDMFAGSFLFGITNGYTPREAARRACYLSREVISQVGARLSGDVRKLWDSVPAQ